MLGRRNEFQRLLDAARGGDERAWRSLVEANAPKLLAYLRAQRVPDAEEVLGDVFESMVRGLGSFRGGEDDFRGWLFRIAQHRVVDVVRALKPTHELPGDEQPGREPDVAERVHARAGEERLYALLGVLPADQRAVVFLRFVAELSQHEVAEVLETSVPAVKMLQKRGLDTLATRLDAGA